MIWLNITQELSRPKETHLVSGNGPPAVTGVECTKAAAFVNLGGTTECYGFVLLEG